jgi:hypothetical protein
MPENHTGAHNTRAREKGGGKLPQYFKGVLAGVGIAVILLGAMHNNSVIVGIGIAFTAAVLGFPFKPPGGWGDWLKRLK